MLPLADALNCRVAMVERDGELLAVMGAPLDRRARLWLQARFEGRPVLFALALPGAVDAWLKQAEASERVLDGVAVDVAEDTLAKAVESISIASLAKDESPVIRLVNMTLYDGLQSRASDIHLESDEEGLLIRYRIDGAMLTIRKVPGQLTANQVMSRLKVLSSLDIAEKRVPQDGRFKVELQGREVDFRVSIMPGSHGENAVLRLLDRSQKDERLSLDGLGFPARTAARIRALAQLPYGLTLITGPTGSGKSTTLYGALSELNTGDEKIITIEDPVEYEMAGVLQIPVNEKKGLTFARGCARSCATTGHDLGGRDPRCGDRRHRRAVGADRASRAVLGARQRRLQRDRPFSLHGRGGGHVPGIAQRRGVAAAGAAPVPALRRRVCRAGGRMRGLSRHRLPGPHRAGRGVAPGQPHEIRAAGAVPGTQAGGPGRLRRLSIDARRRRRGGRARTDDLSGGVPCRRYGMNAPC